MAKKKRKSSGPKKKSPGPGRPGGGGRAGGPVDRRVLEGLMRGFLGELRGEGDRTPLDEAQDLVDQAFGAPDAEARIELARRALAISPDCADAYVLLAEMARDRKEALEYYRQAVAAGERALGPEVFRDGVGDFWGLIETRPYMRARLGLAEALWTAGHRDEAVGHLQEMLRLNPGDNQGVRQILVHWLLALDRVEELEELLRTYPEEFAAYWAYTKALLEFRRHGDSPEAARALDVARGANEHVLPFLLGREELPQSQPHYYSPGDRNEAILYVADGQGAWKATPGAITWLRARAHREKAPRKGPKAKGPTAAGRKRLLGLPQAEDVWQADCRPMPQLIDLDGELVRPWIALVTSRTDDLILGHEISEEEPTWKTLWDVLASAMGRPLMGEPHRPTRVQLCTRPLWEQLGPALDAIAVEGDLVEALDQFDFVFSEMGKQLGGNQPPGLLEMPNITPERVAGFYRAAAHFYRRAPWRLLGYEAAIKVEADRFESGPWYAVVMGQSGLTLGLALYEDLKILTRLWGDEATDEDHARETVALSVTFGEETDVPLKDLDDERAHGWEVAGPEAHPSVFRKERGMSMRPPLAWELELLEGCMCALPDFVSAHRPDETTPQVFDLKTAGGPLRLTLSWVGD